MVVDSHRSSNPTVNCPGEGSRLGAPYEDLMLDDLILLNGELYNYFIICVCVLVAHSCLTVCDPMDCNPPGSSVHGISQRSILDTGRGCRFLLQGIVQIQGWNSDLLHCRQILYCLNH